MFNFYRFQQIGMQLKKNDRMIENAQTLIIPNTGVRIWTVKSVLSVTHRFAFSLTQYHNVSNYSNNKHGFRDT